MVDANAQDLPSKVTNVLRIFLAASARGEQAELVLETRNGMLTTKYRSSETVDGAPATPSANPRKKKMNPARARRSRLRLEEFKAKKLNQKQMDSPAVEDSAIEKNDREKVRDANDEQKEASNSTQVLVLELKQAKDIPVTNELASPIPQIDGTEKQPS